MASRIRKLSRIKALPQGFLPNDFVGGREIAEHPRETALGELAVHDPHSSWTAPRLKSKLAPLAAKIKLARRARGAASRRKFAIVRLRANARREASGRFMRRRAFQFQRAGRPAVERGVKLLIDQWVGVTKSEDARISLFGAPQYLPRGGGAT
jgi:hypothetical protein